MVKGCFIVIEGIDGCGSTTHTKLLGDFLKNKGMSVFTTQEPSKMDIGRILRQYLKNPKVLQPIDALLFAADRVEHYYNEVLPKLNENITVISDRYIESSIAYQAAQGKIEMDSGGLFGGITIGWIEEINKFAPPADLTILLDIDPILSLKRKYPDKIDLDKFENLEFLKIVRQIYLDRARQKKYPIIDSTLPIEDVADKIQKIVLQKLN